MEKLKIDMEKLKIETVLGDHNYAVNSLLDHNYAKEDFEPCNHCHPCMRRICIRSISDDDEEDTPLFSALIQCKAPRQDTGSLAAKGKI